jgi:hypothetical protein
MKETEERDKQSEDRDARFANLNIAFFDGAAARRGGDGKRGLKTCR